MEKVESRIDISKVRSQTTKIPYPHIMLVHIDIYIPPIIHAMEEGPLPIIGTLKGVTKILSSTSTSAININKLLRVSPFDLVISPSEKYRINTVLEYIEVCTKWTF